MLFSGKGEISDLLHYQLFSWNSEIYLFRSSTQHICLLIYGTDIKMFTKKIWTFSLKKKFRVFLKIINIVKKILAIILNYIYVSESGTFISQKFSHCKVYHENYQNRETFIIKKDPIKNIKFWKFIELSQIYEIFFWNSLNEHNFLSFCYFEFKPIYRTYTHQT